jgi:hypothetical protein
LQLTDNKKLVSKKYTGTITVCINFEEFKEQNDDQKAAEMLKSVHQSGLLRVNVLSGLNCIEIEGTRASKLQLKFGSSAKFSQEYPEIHPQFNFLAFYDLKEFN